jgi:uncharacterized repeat protein (TIGR03803 family)
MKASLKNFFLLPTLVAGLGLILTGRATAQTFTTLHSFTGPCGDGEKPQAGLIISGNTLYGACDSGGTNCVGSFIGTVFALNTNGTGYTTLHSLMAASDFSSTDSTSSSTNSDGAYPDGTLIISGNTLYGTAYWGGTNGNGTVFEVNINGTGYTTLHSFAAGTGSFPYNYTNSDGACPEVGLILSGNTLYGASEKGGSNGYGSMFKVNTDGTGFKNLYSFTNGSDGSSPHGFVISGNTLYGAAAGVSGNGTVFAINTNGTGFTILHSFMVTNFTFSFGPAPGYTNSDGAVPTGLTLSGNTLYGTTFYGGTNGNGTVFAINTSGTGFTTLHSFAATSGANYTNSEGTHPLAYTGLILSGNTLYGTTYYGGSACNGTLFAINTNGMGFTTLHSFTATNAPNFTNSDGANPEDGLVISGNTLYGTAKWGGTNGNGTVFSISLPPPPPQLTIIYSGANVILTWPTNATGYTLQSTTNLAPPAVWSTVSPAPVVVNTNNAVTNTLSGTQMFFRLSQ